MTKRNSSRIAPKLCPSAFSLRRRVGADMPSLAAISSKDGHSCADIAPRCAHTGGNIVVVAIADQDIGGRFTQKTFQRRIGANDGQRQIRRGKTSCVSGWSK